MYQIGCGICLQLQKAYSEALRQYTDVMQRQVDYIAVSDFSHAREAEDAIKKVDNLCRARRKTLEEHETNEHKKLVARG